MSARTTTAGVDQAAIDARVSEMRQHAGLDPQPRSEEVNRIRANAGLDAQLRSEEVIRLRESAGLDPKPRSAEVVRIVGSYRPSLLTATERQSLIPAATIKILEHYQQASGFKVLPVDIEKEQSCKSSG